MEKKEYYKKIKFFDEETIMMIHLPKPIPQQLYNELYRKGVLPKDKLEGNQYYLGNCRNADVALWDGNKFIYMREKFGFKYQENINHLEDDNGFDLFIPLKKVIPKEYQKIK